MGKRNAGEGTIFQRKGGRWCGILDLGWEGGKRKRKYVYGATAAQAQDELFKARSDNAKGFPVALERQTVEQFLERWLEQTLKPRAKPRGYESFATIARLHIIPVIGKARLEKLTPMHVQTLLDQKRRKASVDATTEERKDTKHRKPRKRVSEGLSPQTLANIRTVLRSALAQALKWGLVARNVAALVDPPRIPRPKARVLDADQARRLLEAARDGRFEAAYALALTLGMRRGEILGLSWADVDFEGRVLRVSQAVQRIDGKVQITEVKTERSRRVIAMPDSVIRALKLRRAHQAQERLLAGFRWKDEGLVFTNPNGGPLEPIMLHRDFKRMPKAAKLDTATRFHDLRHSTASMLLAQGVHLRVVMELLGHSSISLTANTYSHVMPAAMRDVADRMEEALTAKG